MARCKTCNVLLSSRQQGFCHDCEPLAAFTAATGKSPQVCAGCGTLFPSEEGVLEFWCSEHCSDVCHRDAAAWEAVELAEGRVVTREECVACGTEFETPDGFGDFCTQECADAADAR